MHVLAGRDLRAMTLCSTGVTRDDGRYDLYVPPGPDACTDRGYNSGRGPVSLLIAWRGQQVGGVSTHHDPPWRIWQTRRHVW